MKFLKNRLQFLKEAKVKDLILPRQASAVKRTWSEEYLEYEEVDPTPNIEQGRWKVSEEDKNLILGIFLGSNSNPIDMKDVFSYYGSFPDRLIEILENSINLESIKGVDIVFKKYDARKPTIDQILLSNQPVFKKLLVSDTKKEEYIKRDEQGRPLKDEDNNIIKIKKKIGDPIYDDKNLVSIRTQIELFNSTYNEDVSYNNININSIINVLSEKINTEDYQTDFNIFDRDIYLSIKHNPQDILNMSVSKFYSSCQHLYTGMYRQQLIGNIFDPNSIPAFLIFDTPIYHENEKISDFLPLSRMMIRNIETFDSKGHGLFFDRSYPDRMRNVFSKIIEKYTKNKETLKSNSMDYVFSPDIDLSKQDELSSPYMDKLGISRKYIIGKNTKNLYINKSYDWSNIKISPQASIDNIVIETEKVPSDIFKLSMNIKQIKFRYLKLNSISKFDNIKIKDNISFDKCILSNKVIEDLSIFDIKFLEIITSEIESYDFSKLYKLERISILYTLDNLDQLEEILKSNSSIKEVTISDDIVATKKDKDNLKELKSNFKNIKFKITGLLT